MTDLIESKWHDSFFLDNLASSAPKICKTFNNLLTKRLAIRKHKIRLRTVPRRGLPQVGAAHHGQPMVAFVWAPFPLSWHVLDGPPSFLHEESYLPTVCTSDMFDPNVCKLIEMSGYDFSKPPSLWKFIESKSYKPNDTQKMI